MKSDIIEIALAEIGVAEIKGAKDNPRVLEYFDKAGFDGSKLKDETAWCSAFANWVAYKTCSLSSGKLTARSWLKVGKKTETPEIGDVVVFWRESPQSWKGHVAFFIAERDGFIYVLGGNQNNRVNIQAYPKNRLLEYRDITL